MKIAVVASGWHFPYHFYDMINKQVLPNNCSIDLFCVSHRNPKYSAIEKSGLEIVGDRARLDLQLYSKFATIDDIQSLGWIYKEYENSIGDWGCSNQWLEDYDYKKYDLLLFTHDDNLILSTNWMES
jgi:hypothetical protein